MKKTGFTRAILLFFIVGILVWYGITTRKSVQEFIPIGILHSQTGFMAPYETAIIDTFLLAAEEINATGGILGKQIKPIIYDGKSEWQEFVKGAEYLITQDNVVATFGVWTSTARKAVLPLLEKYNHLLIHPLLYEGLEESPYVFYTGATANQQVVPGVVWAFHNLGKKFFLVGSDYIYPRACHEINKDVIQALGGTIVGEEYILAGSKDVDQIVKKIIEAQPEVIINILVGVSNIPFFQKLREAGITPEKIPTISFTFTELELQELDINSMVGDYAALNYFQSIQSRENEQFITAFRKRFGKDRIITDYMEAAYFGLYLWAQAVEHAKSTETDLVRKSLQQQSFAAPEGIVSIEQHNQHTWKFVRIGKIQSSGDFNIIWTSARATRPVTYPTEYRSREAWDAFLQSLYEGWGRKWTAS